MQAIHPNDGEGDLCAQDQLLEGAATEAQPLLHLVWTSHLTHFSCHLPLISRHRPLLGAACVAVFQCIASHIHYELVAMQEIHPNDGEGDICAQERPLKGAAAKAQSPLFFSPALGPETVGADEAGLLGQGAY
jgi:hypothetical protein